MDSSRVVTWRSRGVISARQIVCIGAQPVAPMVSCQLFQARHGRLAQSLPKSMGSQYWVSDGGVRYSHQFASWWRRNQPDWSYDSVGKKGTRHESQLNKPNSSFQTGLLLGIERTPWQSTFSCFKDEYLRFIIHSYNIEYCANKRRSILANGSLRGMPTDRKW